MLSPKEYAALEKQIVALRDNALTLVRDGRPAAYAVGKYDGAREMLNIFLERRVVQDGES